MIKLSQIDDYLWEIPVSEKKGMRVPARIYASKKLLPGFTQAVLEQLTNVASLPGILKQAICMPDGHLGYGFPIGGVAAFSLEEGVISPGGIGFDINCGVRLIRTNLSLNEVRPRLIDLVEALFEAVPSGTGGKGSVSLTRTDLKEVMVGGAQWCIDKSYGWPHDYELIEGEGKIAEASPDAVSERAIERGMSQLGSLGSGNHYLEIQVVSELFDKKTATRFGLFPGQVVVMVHCGSRGLGHQIATDYLALFGQNQKKYGIEISDPKLASVPYASPEGQQYYQAMAAAANFAFANRQIITHQIRMIFSRIFDKDPYKMDMETIYDVAHNIARKEHHQIGGRKQEMLVHRKGATRAFGPGSKEIPEIYADIGQPVIIGGSMETGSHLLVGTKHADEATFGSTLHGAGRVLSRNAAKKQIGAKDLLAKMTADGIVLRTKSLSGLSEEAGAAYKDISEVINAVDGAGISRKVASFRPIGNIKG